MFARTGTTLTLLAVSTLFGGCTSTAPRAVQPASPDQQAKLLDRFKAMEGEWTMPDEKGVPQLAAVFKVTSAGSAVREIMFPGTPHEMTNMYHMDGSTLVMTHYCAIGNQPRMRATAAQGDRVEFGPDSVTNFLPTHEGYMGSVVVEFKNADEVVYHWKHLDRQGKPDASHDPAFVLTRRK